MDTLTHPTLTPKATRRHPKLGGWRRRILVAGGVAVIAFVGLLVGWYGGTEHEMAGPAEPLPADVRGVYELQDGRELTLTGTVNHIRVELDDRVTFHEVTAADTFASHDGERLTLVRSATEQVIGLEIDHDGVSTSATRTEPYTEHEVTFDSDGTSLAGTLLVPTSSGPHPAVVISHGAEWASRETYRLLATHYARRGVATLIYDKRGTGDSEGDVASATFDDLTADALAGHALLLTHPDVDPERVGIAGFSQGGWIGALAARQTDDVAFVVAYSASGFSPGDQHAWLYGSMLNVRGLGPRPIEAAARLQNTLYSTTDLIEAGYVDPFPHVPGFWFHALDHRLETADLWQQVRQPVLGIWGADDCQVPAHDSAAIIRDALDRGGNTIYTLRVLDGADHSLYLVGPCLHELGLHAEEMRYAAGYLAGAADWINGLDSEPPHRQYEVPAPDAETPLGWHHQPPTSPPWYGHAATQTVTLVVLLAAFGLLTGCAVVRAVRRRLTTPVQRLTAATAAAGFGSVLVAFAALGELAGLGDLHAAQLVGDGPLAGMPPMFLAAGLLATVVIGCAAALTITLALERRRDTALTAGQVRTALLTLGTAAVAVAWASYWQLPIGLAGLY